MVLLLFPVTFPKLNIICGIGTKFEDIKADKREEKSYLTNSTSSHCIWNSTSHTTKVTFKKQYIHLKSIY